MQTHFAATRREECMARHEEYDDDRVVIVERDGGSSSMGTFLLGLAIGAGAALLFAPASGEETRARLQEEARRAGKRVKDMTDEFTEALRQALAAEGSELPHRFALACPPWMSVQGLARHWKRHGTRPTLS